MLNSCKCFPIWKQFVQMWYNYSTLFLDISYWKPLIVIMFHILARDIRWNFNFIEAVRRISVDSYGSI